MDPNDPNANQSQPAPQDANAIDPSTVTLDALYGPSTPGAEPAPPAEAGQSPMPDQMPAPNQSDPLPPMDMPMEPPAPDPMAGQDPMTTMDQPADPNMAMPQEIPAPSADATSFYQDLDPQNQYATDPNAGMAQPAAYDPSFVPTQEQTPQLADQTPPPPIAPTDQPAVAGGSLPPVPSRSKLPIILIGVAVLAIVLLGVAFLFLKGFHPGASTPKPTATPVASQDPCEIDPSSVDCTGSSASPSPTDTPLGTGTPAATPTPVGTGSARPTSTHTPQQCQIIFAGPCPAGY